MVMESGLHELSGMMSGLSYDDFYSDENIFRALGFGDSQLSLGHGSYFDSAHTSFGINPSGNPTSSISTNAEVESTEDSDIFYSDMALNYISRMLMEEDIDEKVSSYKVESALRATEKPFYDILGQKYPPSPDHPLLDACQISGSHHHRSIDQYMNLNGGVTSSSSAIVDSRSICDPSDYQQSRACASSNCDSSDYQQSRACAGSAEYSSPTPSISSNSINSIEEPFTNTVISPNMFFGSMPAWHFKRGVEEAKKFLPSFDKLVINVESKGASSSRVPKRDGRLFNVKAETEKDSSSNSFSSRVRKNPNSEDLDLAEGRSNKQSTVSSDAEVRSEMFDMILLWQGDNCSKKMSALQEAMQNEASKNAQIGLSSGGKSRGKKHTKKEVVDLRTLLILCAQAVATDDRHTANELLKQIRQHSSPNGDGSQRLAYCFADGLEARLAGTGSQIYRALVAKRTTATDILKAYHLYLAACPFKRISHFFSNQTILNLAEKASKVHIIDFGIYFGFQWPCLIQRLSTREGGPPKLRITGIDVPQPGFRPTERIEETGRRLADYAKSFNVPFEYQAIASKWETIRAEDLHIAKDEVVVVNCLYRFRNLIDETVVVDSPRNRVLNTIRRMNPDVFIHGVVNGSYSAPFFVTRFREALFHYSALFDMLEANVPRDDEQRSLIEKDLFGREALNVIACEGSERVERPETYKQWQVRNFRAGFMQLPLDPDIMKKAKDKVKGSYHKDFVIDEDSRWLIQGWKGRIIYAISAWKPSGA